METGTDNGGLTPAPESAAAASDFARQVQFAHSALAPQRTRGSAAGLVIGWGAAGALWAAVLFLRMVARSLGLPAVATRALWAALTVALLAWLLWLFVRWIRANRTLPPNFVRGDQRYRIRCVGSDERLAAVRRLGPIEDTPFEPQEFTGFLVLPPTPVMVAVWVVTSSSVAAALLLLDFGMALASTSVFLFYGAFAAGGVMVVLLWPTRIRVVPGRVEIERALVFRPEKPERRLFTLRTSRVLVDLRRWRAHVTGPSPETSLELWLWPVRGRAELAHAMLMGAASTATPGPMEDTGAQVQFSPRAAQ